MDEINPFDDYIEIFKALSDKTRLKIIWLLCTMDSKICVSEIMDVLGESQYNVSRHLKILKNAALVYEKKEGKWTFYHYREPLDEFKKYVQVAVSSISSDLMKKEMIRCKSRLAMRVDGKCVIGLESKEWDQKLKKIEKKI